MPWTEPGRGARFRSPPAPESLDGGDGDDGDDVRALSGGLRPAR
ncbi:hypothetical protein [Streptomyces sp. NPDC006527]